MSFFLILVGSDSGNRLHVLSFECDVDERRSVALVFTSRHSAEDYIEMAGWNSNYCVEQIEPTEFLKRLISANQCGVTHIAIEPKREEQLQGQIPDLLELNDPYEVYADVLQHLHQKLAIS